MSVRSRWPNETMWQLAVELRQSGLTYLAIAGRLTSEFELEDPPSEDTVRRQIARRLAALKGGMEEDPAQAERSGHWPKLRELASALAEAVQARLPQLLGFPWRDSLAHNPWLVVHESGIGIRPGGDDAVLLLALRQHLSEHEIWERLSAWEGMCAQLAEGLRDLSVEAGGSDLLGRWPEISDQQAGEGRRGRTAWFASSVALVAAERAVGIGRNDDRYDVVLLSSGASRLRWERATNSFVTLGSASTPEELAGLQALHEQLAERLDCASIRHVYESLQTLGAELRAVFGTIGQQAQFPGICTLWAGV